VIEVVEDVEVTDDVALITSTSSTTSITCDDP